MDLIKVKQNQRLAKTQRIVYDHQPPQDTQDLFAIGIKNLFSGQGFYSRNKFMKLIHFDFCLAYEKGGHVIFYLQYNS